ncbi:MAG: thioesterase [Rhodobacteraceae bacterium]|nr:MAG: thioesterase [Paracoccaceae bacterium]
MTTPQEAAKYFATALPHCAALNMEMEEVGVSSATMSMPYDKKLIGDPATGVIHGGAISALMDSCGGASVFLHPDNGAASVTLDLRIDYMRPAIPEKRIYAQATCYHVTRSVAFVRVIAWDTSKDRLIATATGAFSFQHKAAKSS